MYVNLITFIRQALIHHHQFITNNYYHHHCHYHRHYHHHQQHCSIIQIQNLSHLLNENISSDHIIIKNHHHHHHYNHHDYHRTSWSVRLVVINIYNIIAQQILYWNVSTWIFIKRNKREKWFCDYFLYFICVCVYANGIRLCFELNPFYRCVLNFRCV